MSALFNQTNIAPGTAFSGGGGSGSNFPNGISVGVAPTTVLDNADINWGSYVLTAQDTTQNVGLGGGFFLAAQLDGSYKTGKYNYNSILYQGSNGAGSGSTFLSVQDLALGATGTPFRLNGVSTITSLGLGQVGSAINISALVSTLAVAFPGCVTNN